MLENHSEPSKPCELSFPLLGGSEKAERAPQLSGTPRHWPVPDGIKDLVSFRRMNQGHVIPLLGGTQHKWRDIVFARMQRRLDC